ncbi:hypothetical protein [Sphingobacterium psychroaquaticum]|uniref:Uncharacterized protein n=1 Tax=Sphingobacterium psychroaquaticum TaxID=561061 RepID=A0A1X7JV07_9SPHI|nr:hypothetical protein [Sphingobacterium psychroaquaticum]SMG31937.1 hypothetical protein SAMN05660862_2224 [Sphingobacterium psychroaquaticum]
MVHTASNFGNINEVEVIREDLRHVFAKASIYDAEYGFEVSMFISIIGRQIDALYDLIELVDNEAIQDKMIDIVGEVELLLKTLSRKISKEVFSSISDAIYTAKTYLLK